MKEVFTRVVLIISLACLRHCQPCQQHAASDSVKVQPSVNTSSATVTADQRRSLRYQLYRDARNQWRWRLLAANNKTIADGSEGYHNRIDALHGVELVKASRDAPVTTKTERENHHDSKNSK